MNQLHHDVPPADPMTSGAVGPLDADEPLIGASGLASRALIIDAADRPTTLAACFEFVVSHPELPDMFRAEAPAALALIARLTGRDVSQLPCDPVALRPILAEVRLHKHPSSHKRWNAFGLLQSTLILTGWHHPDARKRYKLPKPYEDLLIEAEKYRRRPPLAAFFRYCHRRGLALSDVNDKTLVDYIEWLAQGTLNPHPWATAIEVQNAWKDMQTRCAGWPRPHVRLPPRSQSRLAARADLWREKLVTANVRANRALITDRTERPGNLGACLDFVARHPDVPPRFQRDALGAKATVARLTVSTPPNCRPIPSRSDRSCRRCGRSTSGSRTSGGATSLVSSVQR